VKEKEDYEEQKIKNTMNERGSERKNEQDNLYTKRG
jgi:hypothetical protein